MGWSFIEFTSDLKHIHPYHPDVLIFRNLQFKGVVSHLDYGAPGEIRTPDLMVRRHALENALQSINIGISYYSCPIEIRVSGTFSTTLRSFFSLNRTMWLQRWVLICSPQKLSIYSNFYISIDD